MLEVVNFQKTVYLELDVQMKELLSLFRVSNGTAAKWAARLASIYGFSQAYRPSSWLQELRLGKEYFGRKVNFAPGVNPCQNFAFCTDQFFPPSNNSWLKLAIQCKTSTWAAVVLKKIHDLRRWARENDLRLFCG